MMQILRACVIAAATASIAYTVFAASRLRAFKRRSAETADSGGGHALSVMKPLRGDEPHLYENLRSLCAQDYPAFQVIFCAADEHDPALVHARRLQQEFPGRDIAIAAGNPGVCDNPKIANLLGGIDLAKHEIVVIADSDTVTEPGHLRALAACFADPQTGAASCLYFGEPNETVAARLGAMHVDEQFTPSVLVSAALSPVAFCLGAVMAVRRSVLEEIGGLPALGTHLGDDYMLGKLTALRGHRVVLSNGAVRTRINERTVAGLLAREIRWARTIRAAQPAGFAGSILTHTLAWCAAALVTAPPAIGIPIAAAGAACRFLLKAPRSNAVLIPLRDALTLGVWCAAWLGQSVRWREANYAVSADGRLLSSRGDM